MGEGDGLTGEAGRRDGDGPPVCLLVGSVGAEPLGEVIGGLGWRAARVAGADAVDVAGTLQPDVVVLLDGEGGLDLLDELAQHPRLEWVPMVVTGDDDAAVWLAGGAHDVLSPAMSPREQAARLAVSMRYRAELVGLVQRNRELDDLAGIDVLTDLPNRRRLDERLRVLEAVATRRSEPLGIVLVDIDHFKEVNDTFGHLAGDEVLRQIAARFRAALRAADTIGRWSDPTLGRWAGDEFIVGVAGEDRPAIEAVAERLRTLVASEPFLIQSGPIPVTISVGGAVAVGEPWPELLRRADLALYQVKQTRNATRIVSADSTTSDHHH